jgi:ribosome biogenesis protein Tsr3
MTQMERHKLIELGILTPDCDPRITTSRKVSLERKQKVRRWVREREAMSGVLLTRILERLKTAH